MVSYEARIDEIAYVRGGLKIALKCMLLSRTQVCVDKKKQLCKRWSHLLYRDLWKSIRDMVEYYAKAMGYNLDTVQLADTYLHELSILDKQGDRFRYPTNYGLEYHLQLKKIDYYQAVQWLISIFNFVDGCSYMLDVAYENECEMRAEYM